MNESFWLVPCGINFLVRVSREMSLRANLCPFVRQALFCPSYTVFSQYSYSCSYPQLKKDVSDLCTKDRTRYEYEYVLRARYWSEIVSDAIILVHISCTDSDGGDVSLIHRFHKKYHTTSADHEDNNNKASRLPIYIYIFNLIQWALVTWGRRSRPHWWFWLFPAAL